MTDAKQAQRLIEALNYDYAHAIDDDRIEAWPDFFGIGLRLMVPCQRTGRGHIIAVTKLLGILQRGD